MSSSYKELQEQIAALSRQAEAIREQELANVIAEIKQKIHEYGITAAQLGYRGEGSRASGRNKPNIVAKYRDPDSGSTWGGVGAKPKWLRHYESVGRDKEEFKI
ncbi:H-NS histone family protein [Candidatus Methylospira mobilis]|uniref:H-NS histone family protein n=1 Tax=Candidatus Methylospira mobilis TaxID=1808979 RepID=UPI0028EF5E10|nr:H-NS histone family protein [Candidatus Methylospira mobilis]WNV03508.1 H-NS histone family protein [Candidatus Methylospira mobilis]